MQGKVEGERYGFETQTTKGADASERETANN